LQLTEPSPALADRLRAKVRSGSTRGVAWRIEQLDALRRLLVVHEERLVAAVVADLAKSELEAWASDLSVTTREVETLRRGVRRWMAPRNVFTPLLLLPGRAWVEREPLGAVLVMAPWNFPLQLSLVPVAAALAAGNSVCLKPSELAPATAAALAELVPLFFDPDVVAVVEGGPEVAGSLLSQRWDHILFTGSVGVGKLVLRAAAEHLTPVTLELGGKNPVLVSADAQLQVAARRIMWGRCFNAGQSCVAPDYVLVDRRVHNRLVEELALAARELYGVDPRNSPDLARIVNDRHYQRICALVDGGGYRRLVVGGDRDPEQRYIAPTLLDEVSDDAPVMAEEIFGPVLPIRPVGSMQEAMAFVAGRPRPLAGYVFTGDHQSGRKLASALPSGAVGINSVVLHFLAPTLPFGGVGASGMGAYHGRWGFETFTHRKAVYSKPVSIDPPLGYPPYSRLAAAVLRRLL
jgi:aldehyde dehydrogenase (NAD+)